jgi:hypothetical protein
MKAVLSPLLMVVSILLSLYFGVLAQVSTPDYSALFSRLVPAALLNLLLLALLFYLKPRLGFWLAGGPAALAYLSLAEMAARVL